MPAGWGKHEKWLDGRKLFQEYVEMGSAGSYSKLARWAVSQGMFNPKNGKVSTMGAYQAVWRWALNNMDEARDLWAKAYKNNGRYLSDEVWRAEIIEKARNYLSRPQYENWLRNNPQFKDGALEYDRLKNAGTKQT